MSIIDKVKDRIGGAILGMAMSLIVFFVERKLKKTLRKQESAAELKRPVS